MRGTWLFGVVAVLGACGADESVSPTVPGDASSVKADSTTVASSTIAPATTAPTTTTESAPIATAQASTTTPPTTSPGPVVGLVGGWKVTSGIVDGEPVQLIDAAPITLTAEGSTLSGSAACNSYEFTIEISDIGIVFVEGFVTEIGCEGPLAALEEIYLQSFGPTATYVVEGTTLTWQTPTATWIFDRVPPTPPASLVGTVWVLNGVLYEFGGMSAAGIEEGRIVFAADGTFAGSTSCRDVTGSWAIDSGTISTADVTVAGACTGPMTEIDEIVVQVFEEGFVASIDGDRLSARPRENLGLDFFAG